MVSTIPAPSPTTRAIKSSSNSRQSVVAKIITKVKDWFTVKEPSALALEAARARAAHDPVLAAKMKKSGGTSRGPSEKSERSEQVRGNC